MNMANFKDVPAQDCPKCGEEYVDENTIAQLLQQAEKLCASARK